MARITWNPGDFGDDSYSITVDGARGILSYSRESSERLLGLFGQDQEIQEWAEGNGYTVTGQAHDLKVHGQSPPLERPGFSEVVRAVEEGKADTVVAYRLHRLARDFQTQDAAMRSIWDAGGRVLTLLPRDRETGEVTAMEWKPDRPGSPQWHLRKRYAQMDEDELYSILDRLQSGRRAKMARGGYGGGHRIRRKYGVELIVIQGRREYRPIPAEQAVIKRIFEKCGSGTSYAEMARTLNAEGVPTVTGGPWGRKSVRDLALRGPARPVVLRDELPAVRAIEWAVPRAEGVALGA